MVRRIDRQNVGEPGETARERMGAMKKSYAALESELAEHRRRNRETQRQVELLSAIVRVFRETLPCETEAAAARACLRIAEDLTGSAFSFIGELDEEGFFNTTTLSDAGWNACRIPRPEAERMLKNMPNRGINRIGLEVNSSWVVNEPDSHPAAVERPVGHPPLNSFLGVPMQYAGGMIGMIALANKVDGYSEADVRDVEALSVAIVETLNRRRAERRAQDLAAELQHQVRRVESANKELEAFSYSVSHDLRAPLRHITGFVELLFKRDQDALDEKSRHYLQTISESAVTMGALIDDLLAFSRMGRAEMMTTGVDMEALVRSVVAELGSGSGERQIDWEIDPLPRVEGDAAMLRLVLVNLLSNALKFTRKQPRAVIRIGALSREDEIEFYVSDNGVGFDMRYVNKLFGLFQRLHDATEFEGTGVGLANVQRIVRRHGGRVWAESPEGGGATFRFTLPQRKA